MDPCGLALVGKKVPTSVRTGTDRHNFRYLWQKQLSKNEQLFGITISKYD